MPDINTLRNHLFSTLNALQDKEHPMEVERARAISDVAQTIINSAKIEIDQMRLTGATLGSGFIPTTGAPPKPITTPTGTKRIENTLAGQITTHTMRG